MSYRPYRLEIRGELTVETFHIGSGVSFSLTSDDPILRDAAGKPCVPASSLRGVLRNHLERESPHTGGSIAALFGKTPERGSPGPSERGRLSISDGVAAASSGETETRDHVAIDGVWGAAASGAKFDQEVAAGVWKLGFRMVYEGEGPRDLELALLREGIRALEAGDLTCGANRSRGYGRLQLAGTEYLAHQRTSSEDLAAWFRYRTKQEGTWRAEYDWPEAAPTGEAGMAPSLSVLEIELRVQFDGPVLVRAPIPPMASGEARDVAVTEGYGSKGETTADHVFVTTGPDGRKYLPGSSLRGALRHRALAISTTVRGADSPAFARLFGTIKGDTGQKGLIAIGDGELLGKPKLIYLDHVAIDRITGFAADAKKFATCGLQSPAFRVRVRIWFEAGTLASLALAGFVLRDLQEGLLWCGGGTSRGYGYIREAAITGVTADVTEELAPEAGEFAGARPEARAGRVRLTAGAAEFGDLRWLWARAERSWSAEGETK